MSKFQCWAILLVGLAAWAVACTTKNEAASPAAQPPVSNQPITPFRLAQFDRSGDVGVAIEVNGQLYDLGRYAFSDQGGTPSSMLDLIARYQDLKTALYGLAQQLASEPDPKTRLAETGRRLLAPVLYPFNLLAAAFNYRRHGEEMGRNLQESYHLDAPYIFAKSPRACIIADGESVVLPRGRDRIDWEVELAVIMGKKTRYVSPEEAGEYVFGYTIILDISDRGDRGRTNPQFNADWFSGKSQDGFAPMGAFIMPAEFVSDDHSLNLKLEVNGEVMQKATSSAMIHDVNGLISYISSVQTLEPGDVIATGTPPGVGAGRQPPTFLKAGDVITAEIEGICSIRTPIVASPSPDNS